MSNDFTKHAATLIAGRGIGFLIAVLTPMVVVRVFNKHDYGEYRQLVLVMTTFMPFLSIGMEKSLYYFFPHSPENKSVYLSRTVSFYLITGLVFVGMLYYNRYFLAEYFSNQHFITYALPLGLATLAMAFSLIIEVVLIVERQTRQASIILVLTKISHGAFIIVGALLGGVLYALYAIILYLGIKCLASIWYFYRKYRISILSFSSLDLSRQMKYAIPLGLGGAIGVLSFAVDKFIVSYMLGTENFAVYSIGCYELPFIYIFFQSIGDVILPKMVEMKKQRNYGEIVRIWHAAIEKSSLLGVPAFLFFFYFADLIIPTVFTVKYIAAVPVFRIMLVAILLESTRCGVIPRVFARTGWILLITVIFSTLMIPTTYYMVKQFGMVGAISSLIGIMSLKVTCDIILSARILSLSIGNVMPYRRLLTVVICSLLSMTPLILTDMLIGEINPWVLMVAYTLTFLGIFCFMSYRFRLWKAEDVLQFAIIEKLLRSMKLVPRKSGL